MTRVAAAALALVIAAPMAVAADRDARLCGVTPEEYEHKPTAYACEALAIVERFAVAIDRVDWPSIKAHAIAAARSASTLEDVHGALDETLRELDRHSRFSSPRRTAELKAPQTRFDRVQADAHRIAYVNLRGFSGTDPASMEAYVRTLRDGFAAAERARTCGYIVDLRRNPGGNMWPALLGLQPLLGDGVVGAFRTRDGSRSHWRLDADHASVEQTVVVEAAQPLPRGSAAATRPVAVLLGTETASAGEAVAIAFRERPATRSFGWHTAGLTTANAGFHLSDDATLFVAVAEMTDRNGNAYLPYLKPDEETVAALRVHRTGRYDDVTRKAAAEWLATAGPCADSDDNARAPNSTETASP